MSGSRFEENNHILFVDDENEILAALRRALVDEGFSLHFAVSGAEALNILQDNDIAVIVTDMRMPVMDGLTLLKQVKQRWPMTVRMVLSGYAQLQQVIATVNNADVFRYLLKPWKLDDGFVDALHQAVEYHNLLRNKELLQASLEKQSEMYKGIVRRTEPLLGQYKQDAADVFQLGGVLVDFLVENGLWDKDLAFVTILQKFWHQIPEVLPGEKIPFVLADTSRKLVNKLETDFPQTLFSIAAEEAEVTVYGNQKVYQLLLEVALRLSLAGRIPGTVRLHVAYDQPLDGQCLGVFAAEASLPEEEPLPTIADGEKSYQALERLLSALAAVYAGSVTIIQHQAVLELKMVFKLPAAEGKEG